MRECMERLRDELGCVRHISAKGLLTSVEIDLPGREPPADAVRRICHECYERGVILRAGGRGAAGCGLLLPAARRVGGRHPRGVRRGRRRAARRRRSGVVDARNVRIAEGLRSIGAGWAVLTAPASVSYATGHDEPAGAGRSPFAGGPAVAIVAGDGCAVLVAADADLDPERGAGRAYAPLPGVRPAASGPGRTGSTSRRPRRRWLRPGSAARSPSSRPHARPASAASWTASASHAWTRPGRSATPAR